MLIPSLGLTDHSKLSNLAAAASGHTGFALSAAGVTNGDSHDHVGGDGAQIAYSGLSGLPNLALYGLLAADPQTWTGLNTFTKVPAGAGVGQGSVYINPATNGGAAGNVVQGWAINGTVLAALLANGRLGLGTVLPLALLHVGAGTANNSVDCCVLISRTVADDIAGNGHAFSDSSVVTRGGGIGYNSFDGRVTISGVSFDHYASFQASPTINISGTITNVYGCVFQPVPLGGIITNAYGMWVGNASGAGTIGTYYGLYVAALTKGGTNWGIYTANSTPNFLGGDTTIYSGVDSTTLTVGSQASAGRQSFFSQLGKSAGGTAMSAAWNLTNDGWYTLALQGAATALRINSTNGKIGLGVDPTAYLHIKAGTATAGTAPVKIATGGVLNTTPEPGAIETDALHIYWVKADGTRLQLDN